MLVTTPSSLRWMSVVVALSIGACSSDDGIDFWAEAAAAVDNQLTVPVAVDPTVIVIRSDSVIRIQDEEVIAARTTALDRRGITTGSAPIAKFCANERAALMVPGSPEARRGLPEECRELWEQKRAVFVIFGGTDRSSASQSYDLRGWSLEWFFEGTVVVESHEGGEMTWDVNLQRIPVAN